jgi:hypothetical protein
MTTDQKKFVLSQLQEQWARELLSKIKQLSMKSQKIFREAYFSYLTSCGVTRLSDSMKTVYMDHVPSGEGAKPAFEFLSSHASKILEGLEALDPLEDQYRDNALSLIANFDQTGKTGIGPSLALKALLNVDSEDSTIFDNPEGILGEYFGYRRSATEGEIIRFYVKIIPSMDKNIVRFENYYNREGVGWKTTGFGFATGHINFLIGQAVNETFSRGLGLRSFALKRYDPTGWLCGSLLTQRTQPIAAQVVLVPAKYHPNFQLDYDPEKRVEQITNLIKNSISIATLDEDIVQRGKNGATVFGGPRKASDYIRFLIRNWTLNTLQTIEADLSIDPLVLPQMRKIWELEELLAGVWSKIPSANARYLEALEVITKDRRNLFG